MELFLLALSPATGNQLPIPLLIVSGVIVVACVVVGIVTKAVKGKKNGGKKRRK